MSKLKLFFLAYVVLEKLWYNPEILQHTDYQINQNVLPQGHCHNVLGTTILRKQHSHDQDSMMLY